MKSIVRVLQNVAEQLSVFYPPISEDPAEGAGGYKSVYLRKGESVTINCSMKHLGYPEVSQLELIRTR